MDWLDGLAVDKEMIKRSFSENKGVISLKSYDRYFKRRNLEVTWTDEVKHRCVVGKHMVQLYESADPIDLDSDMIKIRSFPSLPDGKFA